MTNFGIITISHGRDEIFRLWCASMKRLREDVGWFPVAVTGDIGHLAIAEQYEINFCPNDNSVVSEKWNISVGFMMRQYNPYYVIISGSDDLISTHLLKSLMSKMDEDFDMIGIKKIWFYCAEGLYQGRARGIEQTSYLGVCKTLHRRVIEKAMPMWRMDRGWGMDADCTRNTSPYIRTYGTAEGVVFDIKTGENLNKYTMVQNKATLKESWPFPSESDLLWSILGEEEKSILREYENH